MNDKIIPVKAGEIHTLTIRDLGIHGEGIGSADGFTVFVPGALPGETVKVRILQVKKSYASAQLLEVEEASADRVTPECPAYKSSAAARFPI